jgi:hypothetical protein
MQEKISQVCDEIKEFLLKKNRAYGDSAANPVRIFSKADPLEQINVRIDDKLSRMMKGHGYPGDDDELDLIGYLILKRCLKSQEKDVEETIVFEGRDNPIVFDGTNYMCPYCRNKINITDNNCWNCGRKF